MEQLQMNPEIISGLHRDSIRTHCLVLLSASLIYLLRYRLAMKITGAGQDQQI